MIVAALAAAPLAAHEKTGHRVPDVKTGKAPATFSGELVAVDERPGKKIDGGARFLDENGGEVELGKFIDRPTLILPIFYGCTATCGIMLGNLASALNAVPLNPGKDFRVLTISFDEQDDTGAAMETRHNYAKLLQRDYPAGSWKFLTGDAANIRRFTDSIGFKFKRIGPHDFVHPNALVVIARDGTIIRYLYGPTFLPFDIGMALTEATRGTPSLSVRKLVSLCFRYDPETRSYAFTSVRFISIGLLLLIGGLIIYSIRKKDRKQ